MAIYTHQERNHAIAGIAEQYKPAQRPTGSCCCRLNSTTAILGAVHDGTGQGRLRKLGFAIAHQALAGSQSVEDYTRFDFSQVHLILLSEQIRPTGSLVYAQFTG